MSSKACTIGGNWWLVLACGTLAAGCGSGSAGSNAGGANSGGGSDSGSAGTDGKGGKPSNTSGSGNGSGNGGDQSSAGVKVTISPASTSVAVGATTKFTCTVTGATETGCDFSVDEGDKGGTIDATGKYTAPDATGTYHVIATSRADTKKSASATVTVTPPRVVGDCDNLPAVGTWEQTAPQELLDQSMAMEHQYGLIGLAVDPTNAATVYFGTQQLGIWKSTDCGGSWAHVSTGKNGAAVDSGFQWAVAVDPVDPQIIYANSGYGSEGSFLWRSANGGVDWEVMWPPSDEALKDVVEYNFVHKVRIDPSDHQHILVSFHANCKAPYTAACIAETSDGGSSWRIVNGEASWAGAEDQSVWFLNDSKSWLYGSQSNGLWRTEDSGATWKVVDTAWGGHNGGQLYRAKDGTFYLASPAGLLRSADGKSWERDAVAPNGMSGIVGDGTTMWAALGPYRQNAEFLPYFTAQEADGKSWSQFTSPMMFVGAWDLGYDPDHNILYSSNGSGGFWRVVTK